LLDYHKDSAKPRANAPIEIDAELTEVERVLEESAPNSRVQ